VLSKAGYAVALCPVYGEAASTELKAS